MKELKEKYTHIQILRITGIGHAIGRRTVVQPGKPRLVKYFTGSALLALLWFCEGLLALYLPTANIVTINTYIITSLSAAEILFKL